MDLAGEIVQKFGFFSRNRGKGYFSVVVVVVVVVVVDVVVAVVCCM